MDGFRVGMIESIECFSAKKKKGEEESIECLGITKGTT